MKRCEQAAVEEIKVDFCVLWDEPVQPYYYYTWDTTLYIIWLTFGQVARTQVGRTEQYIF